MNLCCHERTYLHLISEHSKQVAIVPFAAIPAFLTAGNILCCEIEVTLNNVNESIIVYTDTTQVIFCYYNIIVISTLTFPSHL